MFRFAGLGTPRKNLRGPRLLPLSPQTRRLQAFCDAPRETRTPTPHKQDKALNLVGVLSLCPDRAVERFASVALDALDASDGTSVTAAVTADYLRASANHWRRRLIPPLLASIYEPKG